MQLLLGPTLNYNIIKITYLITTATCKYIIPQMSFTKTLFQNAKFSNAIWSLVRIRVSSYPDDQTPIKCLSNDAESMIKPYLIRSSYGITSCGP